MQTIAAIHGFDAVVGAERPVRPVPGPIGLQGPHVRSGAGLRCCRRSASPRKRSAAASLAATARLRPIPIRARISRERCKDIALGERRRRPIRAAGIGVVIDPLPEAANGLGGRFADLHQVGPGVRPGRGILEAPVAFGPLPVEGRNRGVGGIGTALIDIPDVALGDGVRGLQQRRASFD